MAERGRHLDFGTETWLYNCVPSDIVVQLWLDCSDFGAFEARPVPDMDVVCPSWFGLVANADYFARMVAPVGEGKIDSSIDQNLETLIVDERPGAFDPESIYCHVWVLQNHLDSMSEGS